MNEIKANISFKDYNKADNIIRYLLNPDDESVKLTNTEKTMYERCKAIHGFRLRYTQTEQIIAVICRIYGLGDRQARNLIHQTEKIFGSVGKVHKEYQRQFLLDKSLKNIQLAMEGRNSTQITKALLAHYKIAGLEEFIPDMPDFSKLEQHKYIINLPPNVMDFLLVHMKQGAIKLTDILPPPTLDDVQEAQEVR